MLEMWSEKIESELQMLALQDGRAILECAAEFAAVAKMRAEELEMLALQDERAILEYAAEVAAA
jgi:hypothetical protein